MRIFAKQACALLLLFLAGTFMAHATGNTPGKPLTPKPHATPMLGASAFVGTGGAGIQAAYQAIDGGYVTLSYGAMRLGRQWDYTLDQGSLDIDGSIGWQFLSLGAEYVVWKKLKAKAGVAYNINHQLKASVQFGTPVTINELVLQPDEAGSMELTMGYNRVLPFVAVGWGAPIPESRIGWSAELGTYYMGSPTVTIIADGIMAPNAEDASLIARNMSGYRWHPILNVHLTVNIF